MKPILVLFPNEWDKIEFASPKLTERFRVHYEGFDLFKFPENARLMWFDCQRFIDKVIKKYRNKGLVAVLVHVPFVTV